MNDEIQRNPDGLGAEVNPTPMEIAETLARDFHDTYERLAPQHGYETRRESRTTWEQVPENNRSLMVAVCAEIHARHIAAQAAEHEKALAELRLAAIDAGNCYAQDRILCDVRGDYSVYLDAVLKKGKADV